MDLITGLLHVADADVRVDFEQIKVVPDGEITAAHTEM